VEADERNLLLVLNEVRKMNSLQRENRKSIDQMSDQISHCQDLFDSVIANNRTTNQSIVREIRADLLRLSILANPNMATMYRNNNRKSITESLYSSERPGELTMKTPHKIFSNITKQLHESLYLSSTGFQTIEPNLYLLVELTNPLGSGKSLYLSTISGGGLLSTTIEIVIDGSV